MEASIETKLRERSATIIVVGLGYAGLPMGIELGRAGYRVIGYDIDARKVEWVNSGRSTVSSIRDEDVGQLLVAGCLAATTDAQVFDVADVAIICVPTPLTAEGEPDMRIVVAAGETIGDHLHRDMMVILQSTSAPSTTRDLLAPVLESRSGLVAGRDFHLVFAPERVDPGNQRFTIKNTPKLVGGSTPESTRLARLMFETCIDEVIPVGSPEIAELAKLTENAFRFINISFANELALLCDKMGVNVWEVIEAAKSKPFAFMPHYPGAGVGGHCIPVVPLFLQSAARSLGAMTELVGAAERINRAMPRMLVDKLEQALSERGKQLADASVLFVGVSYKPDVNDARESASVRVLEEALARGVSVAYFDPWVSQLNLDGERFNSIELGTHELINLDAVMLLTAHTNIDYDMIIGSAPVVIDTHPGLHPRRGSNVVNVWSTTPRRADESSFELMSSLASTAR